MAIIDDQVNVSTYASEIEQGLSMRSASRFLAYLGEHRQLIDDVLFNQAPQAPKSSFLSRDIDKALYGPLRRFTSGGGKRVRPALVMLGCEAVGGDPACTLPVGYAIEYFQSAVVIHDDVEDDGLLRRGKKSQHVREGVSAAVNQGDLALLAGFGHLLGAEGIDDALRLQLLREIVDMELMHMEGQALDMAWVQDGTWDVAPEEYLDMASRKTACHTAATPLALGALCGGGSDEQVRALRDFGMSVGIAYQLTDDLLNLEEPPEDAGKDFRSDITVGKRTLVTVHALFMLDSPEREELIQLLEAHTTEPEMMERAVELMRSANSLTEVRSEAYRMVDEAKTLLPRALFSAEACENLFAFADFCVARHC
jgi:geranylgeranyl diphosphate synthase type I